MLTIQAIARALVPVSSDAAARVSAPNYDEFQSDREVWQLLQSNPESVLKVTMAHCDVAAREAIGKGDSAASLARAGDNMQTLVKSDLTRELREVMFVYEITGPQNPGIRQIGLGAMARTAEIRTDSTPQGTIIRNEGIREPKMRGRADLIAATRAIVGTVNLAIADKTGDVAGALEAFADARDPDYETGDEHKNTHRIWLVSDRGDLERFTALLRAEPEAYVADGNHRSAAAAVLGHECFLTVFFTADRMGISPYNRLVRDVALPADRVIEALSAGFEVTSHKGDEAYQPTRTHVIGLYSKERPWLELRPKEHAFDPADAAESIDHDIVQRHLFAAVFGIGDARDDRLRFVGANKDAAWLQARVDEGEADYAVTLAPVTMQQFIEVCRQNKMMPPKSTWFEPKIRSGLVMALLD